MGLKIFHTVIWNNILNCDLGYPKLRFGISQIAIWDKVRFGLQRSPKSKCGFGISEIGVSIWDIPNRDLGDRWIWATTYTLEKILLSFD